MPPISCFTESSKRPLRLAATHHLLAVRVQRVVDNPLPGVDLVIVPEPEMSETFGNSVESRRLRLVPQGIVGISAIDDLGEQRQCGITTEVVFLDDSVERAFFPVVPKLYVLHVIRDGVFPLRDRHHFVDRDEEKLRLRMDELFYEPRAGNSVHFDSFSRYPLHSNLLLETS